MGLGRLLSHGGNRVRQLGRRPGFWRVHEGENTSESVPLRGFCDWGRARSTSRGEGRAEDCANVWDADLCIKKRESRGRETVLTRPSRTTAGSFGGRESPRLRSSKCRCLKSPSRAQEDALQLTTRTQSAFIGSCTLSQKIGLAPDGELWKSFELIGRLGHTPASIGAGARSESWRHRGVPHRFMYRWCLRRTRIAARRLDMRTDVVELRPRLTRTVTC